MSATPTTTPPATGAEPSPVAGLRRRFCPACRELQPADFDPGPAGRPNAVCPSCRSLERHRFLALLLPMIAPRLGPIDVLLDVAPSRQVTAQLLALHPRRYVRMDLGLDARAVEIRSSLTQLPHPDASVDLLVCYHVLEHIPDDTAAMREIARVLKPGGTALIQVPVRLGAETDEDPDAPEEERLRRFGQADHVRYYGRDFPDRLMAAGLSLHRITPLELVGEAVIEWCRLTAREIVWIAQRSDAPTDSGSPVPGPEATAVTALLDTALGELARTRGQVLRLRRQRAELRSAAASVTTSGPVRRVLGAVRRRL